MRQESAGPVVGPYGGTVRRVAGSAGDIARLAPLIALHLHLHLASCEWCIFTRVVRPMVDVYGRNRCGSVMWGPG